MVATPNLAWKLAASFAGVTVVATFVVYLYAGFSAAELAGRCSGLIAYLVLQAIGFLVVFGAVGWCMRSVNATDDESEVQLLRKDAGKCRKFCVVPTLTLVSLAVLIIAWVVAGAYFNFSYHSAEKLGGTLTVPGLGDKVTVNFENNGMFHVLANSKEDAVFAQGYVHAQLRMWQLEFQRRVGAGRLSELVGDAALNVDKLMRTLGVYAAAKTAWSDLSAPSRSLLQAYADGVNAYLNSKPDLPVAYAVLNFEPEPWTVYDSLVWAKLMSLSLSVNLNQELERFYLYTEMKLSAARIDELMPAYNMTEAPTVIGADDIQGDGALPVGQSVPEYQQAGMAALTALQKALLDSLRDASTTASAQNVADVSKPAARRLQSASGSLSSKCGFNLGFGSQLADHATGLLRKNIRGTKAPGASNNWVVGGNLTDSGKPYLCNDPHLDLTAPSVWIVNHLRAPGFDVIGSSFVGLPGVVIGRNADIAWGVTNVGADVQDLYIMKQPSATNDTVYWYKNAWRAYNIRTEVIKVAGGDPVSLRVRESRYGPVLTDNSVGETFGYYGNAPLCLQWTSIMNIPDTTMDAFLGLNLAKNWADFRQALSQFVAPSQNFVYADTKGNIGYQMPGKIPIRAAGHNGAYPVIGDGTYDWGLGASSTFIPFNSLPRTFNPKRGYIASANNRVTPLNYKHLITMDWDAGADGFRALSISKTLDSRPLHSQAQMAALQSNTISYAALSYLPYVAKLPKAKLDEGGLAAQQLLLSWNGDMAVGSKAASIWAHWYRELTYLAAKETNTTWWNNVIYIRSALHGNTDAACTTETTHNCMEYAARALNIAAAIATDNSGDMDDAPEWGDDIHHAHFLEQLFGSTILGCVFNRETKHGGDFWTVNVGGFGLGDFSQSNGPSYRHVVNLGTLEQSKFLNPLGQSGNIFSRHYADLMPLWSAGEYMDMHFDHYVPATSQIMNP